MGSEDMNPNSFNQFHDFDGRRFVIKDGKSKLSEIIDAITKLKKIKKLITEKPEAQLDFRGFVKTER